VGALITHGVRIPSGQRHPRVEDCVTAADLLTWTQRHTPAKHVAYILDACNSGLFLVPQEYRSTSSGGTMTPLDHEIMPSYTRRPVRAVVATAWLRAPDDSIFFRHFMRILTNPEDQRPMLSLYDLYGEIRQGMDAEVQASHQARRPIYAPNPVFGYWPGTDGGEFMIRYRR
jgi:hypothetical protein